MPSAASPPVIRDEVVTPWHRIEHTGADTAAQGASMAIHTSQWRPDTGRYRRLSLQEKDVDTPHGPQVLREVRSSPPTGRHPRPGRHSDPDSSLVDQTEKAHCSEQASCYSADAASLIVQAPCPDVPVHLDETWPRGAGG